VPSWWRWNHPDHDKVLKGNLKDLARSRHADSWNAFARNLGIPKPDLHETVHRSSKGTST
jgi:hypothetical protein